MIAWGIINELSVEIERLEAITVGDCEELQELKLAIERMKLEHTNVVSTQSETLKNDMMVQ